MSHVTFAASPVFTAEAVIFRNFASCKVPTKKTALSSRQSGFSVLEVHGPEAHTAGGGDGRQSGGECCDDDAQSNLNQSMLGFHNA